MNNFLSPVFADSSRLASVHHMEHSTEYILMAIVVALTIIVISIAYFIYVRGKQVPGEDASYNPIHKLIYKKYYVDEIYDAIITKPLQWISYFFDTIIERTLIDPLVNAFGKSVVWGSKNLRVIQNGNIGFYLFVMVLSIIALFVAKSFIHYFI